ncbi:MAG TPA: hypothetical protein VFL83_11435 [Anaeromyxobacter sp.]|nr:hypothetical protein [Anaeromyxobacter sp.]
MRDVTIRCRADGITELTPTLAPLEPGDRLMVIVTVLMVTGGLFLCGVVPAPVGAAVLASCVAGDVVLAVKAAVLALVRPMAPVHEVPSFRHRRR